MWIYAIEVQYGDGYTWSASKTDLYSTDEKQLKDLCDKFNLMNNDPDTSFEVVQIEVSDKLPEQFISKFMRDWWLGG